MSKVQLGTIRDEGSAHRARALAVAVCLCGMSLLLLALPGGAGAAVSTDQSNYAPGSTVTISGDNSDGAGYFAGEQVDVLVTGPEETETNSCEAAADASGAWSCQITLSMESNAIGSYSYTATGQESQVSQSGSFSDAGCPSSNALGNQKEDPEVTATATESLKGTDTYTLKSPNKSSVGGVPGLIEYCVYSGEAPTKAKALYTNLQGNWEAGSGSGYFDFGRARGNLDNVPFDGTTQTIGEATWSSGKVGKEQTIVLHINDTHECTLLYGGNTETCFVKPGKAKPAASAPTATVTADPSFTRTYKWGIAKSAETTEIDNSSGSATFNYKVSVSHDSGTDSNWQASGTVKVSNSNSAPITGVTVTDAVNDAHATCVVTGGSKAEIPAAGSKEFAYTCTYSAKPSSQSETDTATVTWGAQELSNGSSLAGGTLQPTAPVNGVEVSPTIVDGSVTIGDTLAGSLGTVSYTEASPKQLSYSHGFSGDTAGTCTSHENIASFETNTTHTTGSASKTVKHCVGADLKASKTATPSFLRTYKWGISKSVDRTEAAIAAGGSAAFKYTVAVTHDSGTDSGWSVAGKITVSNPNDWEAVSLTGVSDAIDNGGSCSITGGNPTGSVPAGSSVELEYACTYSSSPAPAAFTNTATATWSSAAASTPDGAAEGHASGTFSSPTIVDGSVNVSDTLAGALGSVSYTDASPKEFSYWHTFNGDPSATCTTHENTASFKTGTTHTTGSASQPVKVCVGADLNVSKTATPSFQRTYKWGISKSVDKTEVEVPLGGSAAFKYTVAVTHDSGTDSAWSVGGKITVSNPNDWEAVALTGVSDAIDNGGSCSITGGNPTGSVPAGSSVELEYACTYSSSPAPAAFTNTATATWSSAAASTPDGSAEGQASGTFSSPTIVDGSVNVSDTVAGALGSVSYTDASPKEFSYSHTYSGDPAGTCTTHENTASFETSTTHSTGSASKSVKVCVAAACTKIYGAGHFGAKTPQGETVDDNLTINNGFIGKEEFQYSWELKLKHLSLTKLQSASCVVQGSQKTFTGHGLATVNKAKGYEVTFTLMYKNGKWYLTLALEKAGVTIQEWHEVPYTTGKETLS
ncbi:MAG TPA: hypothetical protein VHT27_07045 [Solirubrobacteraceae bacterium]|jgi:hypothetical protein|nr:hypothetical protein [Solirubrobacteraceae bacterium]